MYFFTCSTLEGSRRTSDAHPPHYLNRLNCSTCGAQSPHHSEVCPNTSRSRLSEDMAELHSEYSDSSCGMFVIFFKFIYLFSYQKYLSVK